MTLCSDGMKRVGFSAVESDSMEGAAGAVAVSLALAVAPAPALDLCSSDPAAEGEITRGGKTELEQDLPPAGQWRISSRDAGSRVREGCGIGVIEASLAAVREVIDAAAHFDEFMPRVLESEVEAVSPGVYLNRQVLDAPFPVEDRQYTVRVETENFETGSGPGWQARWNYVEGSGNVRESTGSWTLIPLDQERTVVVYRVLTDPGGMLPAWIVDYAAPRTLRRVLRAVRDRVLSGE